MKLLLAFIVMGAVEDEGTFWIQLLMIVTLAAGVGIYGLVKSRAKRIERQTRDETIETIIAPPFATGHASPKRPAAGDKPRQRDLSGGMELLARNFLVSVVEQTSSPDQRDIEMRRLCFTELKRRGELWAIASVALKIYTLDEDGFYGKIIRCEAMAELAGRTRPGGGAAENSETTNEPGRSRTPHKPPNAAETPSASTENQEQAESPAHHRAG